MSRSSSPFPRAVIRWRVSTSAAEPPPFLSAALGVWVCWTVGVGGHRIINGVVTISMSHNYAEVLTEVLALDRESKTHLAERLAIDLASDDAHTSAWVEESNRRFDAYKRGEIEAVDAKEAIAKIRARLLSR